MSAGRRLLLGLSGIAILLGILSTLGTYLMNRVLLEFFGAGAPQPGVLAWATLWTAVFIFRNAELNVEFDRLRFWISGKKPDSPIDDLRDIRRELREATRWMEEEVHESHLDQGLAREWQDDVGEAIRPR